MLLLLSPQVVFAASTFDLFWDESKFSRPSVIPTHQVMQFVINEMRHWEGRGIVIGEDDIKAAMQMDLGTLCLNKVDVSDQPLTHLQEMGTEDTGCLALRKAILSLLFSEKEAMELGNDLLSAANGSELSIADEPHRLLRVGALSLILKEIWSGKALGLIPWDTGPDLQRKVDDLDDSLLALTSEELDAVILRFHYGYFRDQREQDPRFSMVGLPVVDALQHLADELGITGDPKAIGEFTTPGPGAGMRTPNVALWARKDDIGLGWIHPPHFSRLQIREADQYPVLADEPGATTLAYPFNYGGSTPSSPPVKSPLCSRTVARYGYLCRRVPVSHSECQNDEEGKISLVECTDEEEVTETKQGPSICLGLDNLYIDDGTPLVEDENPGQLHPDLTPADTAHLCSPETKILYQDDISAHACYIGLCLLQSMSGHTLIPNRNPVLTNETTSPYASCVRADPQLGLYSEAAHDSPYPLPDYIGHQLVQEFDREYCQKTGDAPRPVLGDCAFFSNQVTAQPSYLQHTVTNTLVNEAASVARNQENFLSLATAIGQRVSIDQTVVLERKLFAGLAAFMQQMADLLSELKRAPITTTACPWTGPFQVFGS